MELSFCEEHSPGPGSGPAGVVGASTDLSGMEKVEGFPTGKPREQDLASPFHGVCGPGEPLALVSSPVQWVASLWGFEEAGGQRSSLGPD